MKKLQFLFMLIDRVSAPAKKMTRSLRELEAALKSVKKAGAGVDKVTSKIGGAKKETTSWADKLTGLNSGFSLLGGAVGILGSIAGAAVDVATGIAQATYEAGKFALEAAGFKEQAMIGLEVALGSHEKAAETFKDAVKFAADTPFETQDVLRMTQDLLTAGFSGEKNAMGVSEVSVLRKAIGDMASARGMSQDVIYGITKGLSDIRARGKLAGQELNQLAQYGIGRQKVFESLAKNMGITVKQAMKLQETGKIDADHALYAIVDVMKGASGGKLGNLMEKQSKSLLGMLSTIKSRPFEMLMDLDESEGFAKAKGFMANLGKALDPSSGPGARVKKRVEALFDDLFGFTFGGLSGEGGADQIATWIEHALGVVEAGWNTIKGIVSSATDSISGYLKKLGGGDFGKGMEVFFKKVGDVITRVGAVIEQLIPITEKIIEIAGWVFDLEPGRQMGVNETAAQAMVQADLAAGNGTLFDALRQDALIEKAQLLDATAAGSATGEALAQGLTAGLRLGTPQAVTQVQQTMSEIKGAAAKVLDMHSPSKVFEHMGLMSAAGMAKGLELGAKQVEGAAEAGIAAPAISGGAPRGGRAGTGVVVNGPLVAITLDGNARAEENEAMLRRLAPELLLEATRKLNEELGSRNG
jgi:tape measure domain-containing protein